MKILSARFEWKIEDLWVGVFWRHTAAQFDEGSFPLFTDVWVCLVPCLPLHITIQRKTPPLMSEAAK